jgi:hypothetical protein
MNSGKVASTNEQVKPPKLKVFLVFGYRYVEVDDPEAEGLPLGYEWYQTGDIVEIGLYTTSEAAYHCFNNDPRCTGADGRNYQVSECWIDDQAYFELLAAEVDREFKLRAGA